MPQSEIKIVEDIDGNLAPTSPIFVTGYMHSATTLMQKVLGRHAQVFCSGGETRHFSHLAVIRQMYPNLDDEDILTEYAIYLLHVICTGYARVNLNTPVEDPLKVIESCGLTSNDVEALVSLARHNRDHALLLGTAYDYLTKKAGKKRWLDKSPSYISYLDEILALFPESKVIIMVRDPRDILASKLRRTQKKGNYDPVWDAFAWRMAVRAGDNAEKKHPDRVIQVRYEDLVTRSREEVQRICEFLDLEYDDSMLSVDWINTSIPGLSGPGIGTSAMGKWRKTLPVIDAYLCQLVAKEEMLEHNYQIEQIPSSVLIKSPAILGRSFGEFFRRLYVEWVVDRRGDLTDTVSYFRTRFKALG